MHPRKRWMAVATREADRWKIAIPERVGETADLFSRLRQRRDQRGSLFIGFDFPIGLPQAYGEHTGFSDFKDALKNFGSGAWADWYSVCEDKRQISIQRPFYPYRPGGRKLQHLFNGLGFREKDLLLRICERKTDERQAACMLFWTLGGNQVGKGAISGWRELLAPKSDQVSIWPFDGRLNYLLEQRDVVVAETYPAEVYGHLGISRRPAWSKREVSGRKLVSGALLEWLGTRPVDPQPGLRDFIAAGFPGSSDGEDQFDAIVGLFGMLDVVDERRPNGCPDVPAISRWEGWILGQALV